MAGTVWRIERQLRVCPIKRHFVPSPVGKPPSDQRADQKEWMLILNHPPHPIPLPPGERGQIQPPHPLPLPPGERALLGRPLPPFWRTAIIGALWLLAGCLSELPDSDSGIGSFGDYEDRLKATQAEFAYYSLLDQNLSPTVWEEEGIALRVPKPFQFVPASKDERNQEHALSREVLSEPLPGVLGTWKAMLPSKNAKPPQTGYLFLLSNHHLSSYSRTSAMAFHQVLVEDVLAELSGLSVLPIKANFKPENLTGHGQPYSVATFQANLLPANSPANFTLFLFQNGLNERRDDIKAALLFVIPKEAAFPGSLPDTDPKALSAQTLHITPRPLESP